MKKITLILFLLQISIFLSAQKITISGYVQDSKTKEKLIGATVFIPHLKIGTQTNAYGFYSLTFPKQENKFALKASYIGYQIDSTSIETMKNSTYIFNLTQQKTIREVVVKSKKSEAIQESTQMSKIDLPIATIKNYLLF